MVGSRGVDEEALVLALVPVLVMVWPEEVSSRIWSFGGVNALVRGLALGVIGLAGGVLTTRKERILGLAGTWW